MSMMLALGSNPNEPFSRPFYVRFVACYALRHDLESFWPRKSSAAQEEVSDLRCVITLGVSTSIFSIYTPQLISSRDAECSQKAGGLVQCGNLISASRPQRDVLLRKPL